MAAATATDWHIVGEEVGSCNCDWGCPCQFNALPTGGSCRAIIGYEIREGHFGDTDLSGVRFAELVSWPGPIHEGDGTTRLIVDENASAEQRDAIEKLVSGEYGGTYFEIFSSVLPHKQETVSAPVQIETDRERRVASVTVGDLAETTVAPITNPVSGEEHRVRIDLPDGFEYRLAEVANTTRASASSGGPLSFTLENTYAQLNEFDWSPAA